MTGHELMELKLKNIQAKNSFIRECVFIFKRFTGYKKIPETYTSMDIVNAFKTGYIYGRLKPGQLDKILYHW